jgi:hypothetical protein
MKRLFVVLSRSKMTRSMDDDFTYFVKITDERGDRYYLKSSIDERTNTIHLQLTNLRNGWIGSRKQLFDYFCLAIYCFALFPVNQQQVRLLAKTFPAEAHDSFYSHTQRAFSKGNNADSDGRAYVFNCKKTDKNRLEVC